MPASALPRIKLSRLRRRAACLGLHEFLQRLSSASPTLVAHLLHNFFPRPLERASIEEFDAVPHGLWPLCEIRQHRAEQLQLSAGLAFGRLIHALLDFVEHRVGRVGLVGQLCDPVMPRLELGIVFPHPAQRHRQLDVTPDAQLIPMLFGCCAFELRIRLREHGLVVQDIREINARFRVIVVEIQRLAQARNRRIVIAESVLAIPDERDGLRAVGRVLHHDVEEFPRIGDQPFAKERATALQHEIEVVLVPQLQDAAERLERGLLLIEPQQRLAESGEGVFMIGVEDERFFERPLCPRKLFPGKARISDADV
jgi:hypothetical protein